MIETVETVCEQLPHFGTITQQGKDIEIWAKPYKESLDEYKVPGIYCIENYYTNRIYIGMSFNIHNRIIQHKRELNPNAGIIHHNKEMYQDSVDYGLHNFSYGILETFEGNVNRAFLMKREEEWIKFYESQSQHCIYNSNRCSKYEDVEVEAYPEHLQIETSEPDKYSQLLEKFIRLQKLSKENDREWLYRIAQVKELEIRLEAAEKLAQHYKEEATRYRHLCIKHDINVCEWKLLEDDP